MADTDTFEYDVFLSHNRADKDWTRTLAARIERETWKGHTLKVFFDEWDIQPGDNIPIALEHALPKSRKIALVMSPDFFKSEWTESERAAATIFSPANRAKRTIPLLLRDCEIPSMLSALKYIDFRDAARFESAFAQLLAFLREEPLPRADPSTSLRSVQDAAHTAPIPRPPVIGFVARRDKDGHDLVRYVGDLLAKDNAFVVLWGAGGIGKTALAAEIARKRDAVVWTSADGRADFSLGTLLDAAVTQLGHADMRTLEPDAKTDAARDLLAETHALLVLDNFETVADVEYSRLTEFLESAPCAVLITSRRQVTHAHVIPIDIMNDAEASEFLTKLIICSPRSRSFAGLDFEQIIKAADANPKVMEWIVAQIEEAKEPQRVFQELSRGRGDAAERVFNRSFKLGYLGNDGRSVLLVLTLFVPDASREALSEVAGLESERVDDAISRIISLRLADTSALNARIGVAGLTRELARVYLRQDKHNEEWMRRFVSYFVRYANLDLTSKDTNALEVERDNLLTAMDLAFAMTEPDLYAVRRIAHVIVGSAGLLGRPSDWSNAVSRAEQMDKSAFDLQSRGPARHLRIFLQRTSDQDEDVRRMRELLNLLRSIPGRDRFTFFVPNPQGTVQLDFPNFSTSYAAVQEALDELVGEWGSMEVQ